jgi:hypothetical protein
MSTREDVFASLGGRWIDASGGIAAIPLRDALLAIADGIDEIKAKLEIPGAESPAPMRARRAFLRRVFEDGTVEEHNLEFDYEHNRVVGDPPPVDTSVIGTRWTDEIIVEWDETTPQLFPADP